MSERVSRFSGQMKSTSKENLITTDVESAKNSNGVGSPYDSLPDENDYILTPIEKKFLLCAERGDCAGVRR